MSYLKKQASTSTQFYVVFYLVYMLALHVARKYLGHNWDKWTEKSGMGPPELMLLNYKYKV